MSDFRLEIVEALVKHTDAGDPRTIPREPDIAVLGASGRDEHGPIALTRPPQRRQTAVANELGSDGGCEGERTSDLERTRWEIPVCRYVLNG